MVIIELLVGLLIALVMFVLGMTLQTIRKLVKVVISVICKILNKVGIKLNYGERKLKVDPSIIDNYKVITRINRGKLGMRKKKSVNIFAIILIVVSLSLIIINLDILTGNVITKWLTAVMTPYIGNIGADMNTIYTAAVFSVLSFGLTKLLGQWKETSEIRKEKRHQKKKKALLEEMSADELIVEAERKGQEKIKLIKEGDNK